jgi:2-hydroxycyclohexanecarboxyl-CoA dehydrogenase
MSQKIVIVTGGASGIGRAIVDGLVAEGYGVRVLDLNEPGLDELAAAHGPNVQAAVTDISDHDAVAGAVAAWVDSGDAIWGLVNNAGWDEARRFVDTEPAFWRKVIDINLFGPLNVTHAVLPHLAAAGGGRVVSIASDAGRVGSSGEAVYSAAKGGTIALMKSLAREHARDAVTFNSICPGPTDTPLLASVDETGRLQQSLERAIPMRRLARPEDYPALVKYFLSDDAGYVTGQTISVSGGLSMNG